MSKQTSFFEAILNTLPLAFYVIDKDMRVCYHNEELARIFQLSENELDTYVGSFLQCNYCFSNGPDTSQVRCNHCEIINQHDQCFEKNIGSDKIEIVHEFIIDGQPSLKYVSFQSIPLDSDHILVLVEDLTQTARKYSELQS